ncbi:hypothetical protein AYI68_g4183 [Smittium mucronatum]|uniref:Uncharacterized protein n=1 Tax=Smittium mucronatum TaxID=133383 RepID=A0A1R0GXY4_9FUNG|nr:hypothetical protein AYI68_g4183 [Smittium mucronatum]
MSSVCVGCGSNLKLFYDVDSECCINCGTIAGANDFVSSVEITSMPDFNYRDQNLGNNVMNPHLLRWGWKNQAQIRKNTNNDLADLSNSGIRYLDSQYSFHELIKDVINPVARILNMMGSVERAMYLVKLSYEKRLSSGKYLKFGDEGKLVGLSCLFISSREKGDILELSTIATAAGIDLHNLGSIYKKVRHHLGINIENLKFSTICEKLSQIFFFKLGLEKRNPRNLISSESKTSNLNDKRGKNTCSKADLDSMIKIKLTPFFKKSFSDDGYKGVYRLASKILSLAEDSLIFVGKNTSFFVGSSIFLAIQFFHSKSSYKESELDLFQQSLLLKLTSKICGCSESTIKNNSKLIVDLIIKLGNQLEWYFGKIFDKKTVFIFAEKIIEMSLEMKQISILSKNQASSSTHDNFRPSIDHSIAKDFNLEEIKSFEMMSAEMVIEGSEVCSSKKIILPEKNTDFTKILGQKLSNKKSFHQYVCHENNLPNCFRELSDSGIFNGSLVTNDNYSFSKKNNRKTQNLDWERMENLGSVMEPKKFTEHASLRKFRIDIVSKYLLINDKIGRLRNEDDKIVLIKNPLFDSKSFIIDIHNSFLDNSDVSDERIIISLLILESTCSSSILSLPISALRDILLSEIRSSLSEPRDLNNPTVSEMDVPDSEILSYLKNN